jgi:hypothetical protein
MGILTGVLVDTTTALEELRDQTRRVALTVTITNGTANTLNTGLGYVKEVYAQMISADTAATAQMLVSGVGTILALPSTGGSAGIATIQVPGLSSGCVISALVTAVGFGSNV